MYNEVGTIGEEAVTAYFKAYSDNCLERLKNSMKQPQSRYQLEIIGYCHSTDNFTTQERTFPIHWIHGQV
jgi:hypothetical protein